MIFCNSELRSFERRLPEFAARGAEIVATSVDSPEESGKLTRAEGYVPIPLRSTCEYDQGLWRASQGCGRERTRCRASGRVPPGSNRNHPLGQFDRRVWSRACTLKKPFTFSMDCLRLEPHSRQGNTHTKPGRTCHARFRCSLPQAAESGTAVVRYALGHV